MRRVKPQQEPEEVGQADLYRLVDAQLRAEHDGDIEAILAPMAGATTRWSARPPTPPRGSSGSGVGTATCWRQRVALAGLLLLAACSSSSTPRAGQANPSAQHPTAGDTAAPINPPSGGGTVIGGSVDPCSLLTQAEVDTAVGQPLGPGKQVATLDDCLWTTADFTAGVDVTVSDWPAIKTAATSTGGAPTSVPGLGDEALYKGAVCSTCVRAALGSC